MCYDISFTVRLKELSDYFPDLVISPQLTLDFPSTDHIVGHQYSDHPILYRPADSAVLHCSPMEWGCIPFYVKEEKSFLKQRASMLNARSERVLSDSKSYWNKIRNRRCLVPVSGIYEHRGIRGWKKKIPYFITMVKEPLFFLPGLYSVVELPDMETGELIRRFTFTILTRNANSLMQQIHNDGENRHRMPLFLSSEQALRWLSAELSPEDYQQILNTEMPSDALRAVPVFTIRGARGRPDGKAKYEPWTWEQLPALGELNPG